MRRPGSVEMAAGVPAALFFAHFLVLLSCWTLIIKYLLPVAFALAEGVPLATHVMWDFWWVAHLFLAWALVRRPPYLFLVGTLIAAVEIVIVVTKFALFLPAPDWTIWTMNWFVNKVFVLGCFSLMLPWLLANRGVLGPAQGGRKIEGTS